MDEILQLLEQTTYSNVHDYHLIIPYDETKAYKPFGIQWDKESKRWTIVKQKLDESLVQFVTVYLTVPFKNKDQVKALGASWSADRKQWCIPLGLFASEVDTLAQWFDDRPISAPATISDSYKAIIENPEQDHF